MIFISHDMETDGTAALQLCAELEKAGIPCWIAPRNIAWGKEYGEAVVDGIENCQALLLVLSAASNASIHVGEEVERASSKGKQLFVLRLDGVAPAKRLELFVSRVRWLDVFGSLQSHLPNICTEMNTALGRVSTPSKPVYPPFNRRLETVIPDLEKMNHGRNPLRILLMIATAVCVASVAVGVVITLTSPSFSRLGIFFLLLGVGGCLPCGMIFSAERSCSEAVSLLSMALRLQNENHARKAIDRLRCFKGAKELLHVDE